MSCPGLFRELTKHGPLTREREAHLAVRTDAAARDELVCSNLAYVVSVAKELGGRGVPFEDLLHEGCLGLIEAARRFDGRRGVKFITYARWWIRKGILQALSAQTGLVSIPDHRRRELQQLRGEREVLERREGRRLTWDETAALSARTEDEVARIREAEQHDLRLAETEEESVPLVERLPDAGAPCPEASLIQAELEERMAVALDRLPQRHRRVVTQRFGLDGGPALTLREVGEREGLSRERARQIECESLGRLARLMDHHL